MMAANSPLTTSCGTTSTAPISVVHDLNPRALSPKAEGFVQAQSWFQDLTPVSVAP
jgi:hypothetical protein